MLGGKPTLQLGNAKKQPPAGAMRMRRLQGKNKNAQKKGPNFGSINKPSRAKRENAKGVQWLMESAMRSKLRPDKNPFPEEHLIASDHYAERQRRALAASMAQARAKAKQEEQDQRLREEAARRAADAEENRQRMHMQAFINNRVVSERRRAAHETRHRSAANTTKAIQPKFAGRSEKKKIR